MTRRRKHARPCANMLKALTVREASRYIELREEANGDQGILLDLCDPCDRAILDECLSPNEALELLSLHDRLADAFAEFEDTKRISSQEMEAVRSEATR